MWVKAAFLFSRQNAYFFMIEGTETYEDKCRNCTASFATRFLNWVLCEKQYCEGIVEMIALSRKLHFTGHQNHLSSSFYLLLNGYIHLFLINERNNTRKSYSLLLTKKLCNSGLS